jgi:PTS system nitrogen regulatory IIA component
VSATGCGLRIDCAADTHPQESSTLVNITDLIARDHMPDRVIAALRVSDKPQLLRDLSQRAAKLLAIDTQTVLDALEAREALGSTGVGQGIAVPHARIGGLHDFFGLFARLDRPIDFTAIDERPVDLVFLLLTPDEAGNDHLAALACVSRRLRDHDAAAQLRAAKTGAELYEILALQAAGSPPSR